MNQLSSTELKDIINKIKTIVTQLNKDGVINLAEKEEYFFKHHSVLMNQYPFLISQLCSGEDNTMLDTMLKEIDMMKSNKVKDINIGEKLANNYLKNL